ncbi:MAG: 30S ribosomal protein S20 [Candidatus Riflebacteria bacterium]|nr:30S ribosomal protein S20 [Candidatus Riflebacteria bacterium]
MANTKSAAKNARKAARRHTLRVSVKSELKTLRKRVITAAETKAADVNEVTRTAIKKYAKAASNKYIHPKTAARKISRLMKAVNRLQD